MFSTAKYQYIGEISEAQDVGTFNNLAMRICEAEMDYAKELQAVTEAKACASVEEFDQVAKVAFH